jgi:hypothetical protein
MQGNKASNGWKRATFAWRRNAVTVMPVLWVPSPRDTCCKDRFHGSLATTRLDIDFHVRHSIRAVSATLYSGVRLGARMDFLAGARSGNEK